MGVKIYITSSSEMCIKTLLKNTLINCTETDMITKILVSPPVDWNEYDTLFTKRIQLLDNFIGY